MIGVLLIFLIFVNGVLALPVRALPSVVFDENRSVYKIALWEKRFYKWIGLHKWKKLMPEAGWMTGFSRKNLPKVKDAAYVNRLIWETCCAMLGHFIMAFVGLLMPFAILLPWTHNKKTWLICLWFLAVVHFTFQILLVMIQRYNLPRFIRLKNLLNVTPKIILMNKNV
jgi:hypothetical protein